MSGHESDDQKEVRPLIEVEHQAILHALKVTQGSVESAATLLGIGASTLYRWIKQQGIGKPVKLSLRRGFAGMDLTYQRKLASQGGKAAHAKGVAPHFTPETGRLAGQKGAAALKRQRPEQFVDSGQLGGISKSLRLLSEDQHAILQHLHRDGVVWSRMKATHAWCATQVGVEGGRVVRHDLMDGLVVRSYVEAVLSTQAGIVSYKLTGKGILAGRILEKKAAPSAAIPERP